MTKPNRQVLHYCVVRLATAKSRLPSLLTHSLEREVALEDHLADLGEDGALGIGQVHLPDACVSNAALVLLLGLFSLAGGKEHRVLVRVGDGIGTSNGEDAPRAATKRRALRSENSLFLRLPSAEPPPPASSSSPAAC